MIHLVWSPNKEDDLTGYNIYRKEGDAEPVKLNTDPVRDVQFQDRAANQNKIYTYFVTAEDKAGNESGPSNQVEAFKCWARVSLATEKEFISVTKEFEEERESCGFVMPRDLSLILSLSLGWRAAYFPTYA